MSETASRELQIPKQLDEIQNSIESLGKAIESLSMRLNKIALPEGPQLEGGNNKVPVLCEYADNLANKAAQLCRLRDLVVSLESRLEL